MCHLNTTIHLAYLVKRWVFEMLLNISTILRNLKRRWYILTTYMSGLNACTITCPRHTDYTFRNHNQKPYTLQGGTNRGNYTHKYNIYHIDENDYQLLEWSFSHTLTHEVCNFFFNICVKFTIGFADITFLNDLLYC